MGRQFRGVFIEGDYSAGFVDPTEGGTIRGVEGNLVRGPADEGIMGLQPVDAEHDRVADLGNIERQSFVVSSQRKLCRYFVRYTMVFGEFPVGERNFERMGFLCQRH